MDMREYEYFVFRWVQRDFMPGAVQPERTTGERVRFADVAGLREAKQEVSEVVDYLVSGQKYRVRDALCSCLEFELILYEYSRYTKITLKYFLLKSTILYEYLHDTVYNLRCCTG